MCSSRMVSAKKSADFLMCLAFLFVGCYGDETGDQMCTKEHLPGAPYGFVVDKAYEHLCGHKTFMKADCCPGYASMSGEYGCPMVKPIESLFDSIIQMKGIEFASFINTTAIKSMLDSSSTSYTVLAPINKAILDLPKEQRDHLNQTFRTEMGSVPLMVSYHVVKDRFWMKDLDDSGSAISLHNAEPILFQNFISGIYTANCVPIIQTDYITRNGLIHTVSDIVKPILWKTDIATYISENEHFKEMTAMITKAQMMDLLRKDGPFTVFLPDKEAFERLSETFTSDIMSSPEAVNAVVMSHISKGLHCAASITEHSDLETIDGSEMVPSCTGFNEKMVGGALIKKGDIMLSNGVIHIIDNVIIPPEGKLIMDGLRALGVNRFLQLINETNMEETFNKKGPYTIFAPTDSGFQAFIDEYGQLPEDPVAKRIILRRHILPGFISVHQLPQGRKIASLSSKKVRINMLRKVVSVENALVLRTDYKVRNGIIHTVDRIISNPNMSVGDYILSNPELSYFRDALNQTDTGLLTALSDQEGPFTIFALSNNVSQDAVEYMTYMRMLQSVDQRNRIVKNHIVDDFILIRGMEENLFYQIFNRNEEPLYIHKQGTHVSAGIAHILRHDLMCTNGIVHIVDRLLQRPY